MINTFETKAKGRRTFLKNSMAMGAAIAGANALTASPFDQQDGHSKKLPPGDVAILRFVAAAELIETDLWQQYAELGGVTEGTQTPSSLRSRISIPMAASILPVTPSMKRVTPAFSTPI